jgi:hypothetical protein
MADIKVAFATSTALTISLGSLASSTNAGRESTAVDNTSNKYLDALVQVKIVLQTGTPSVDKSVYVYAYGSEDGSMYTDNATGSDAAITFRVPTAMVMIGAIPCPDAGGVTYESQPMSVAMAFGGYLPRKWGLAIRNYTGVTFSTTGGDHSATFTGIYYTSV